MRLQHPFGELQGGSDESKVPVRVLSAFVVVLALAGACLLASVGAPRARAAARIARVVATQHGARHARVDEQVAAAGLYEVTVQIHTNSRHAHLTVRIGSVVRRVRVRRHIAVLRTRLLVRGHRVSIVARARRASPRITASWRLLNALETAATGASGASGPTGATGSTGATGASAPVPVGPPNPIAVGVNVAATSGNFFTSSAVLGAIDASAPGWVRVFIGWNAIEPQQGGYNTAEIANYAQFFASLPPATRIDVDVWGTPAWAAGGSGSVSTPPVDDADYASFLSYLVGAFGGRVTAWEIWNEEDSSGWWSGTPAQYAALLAAADAAVKAADPAATVILGGLTGNDAAYLAALYAAGAAGTFDAVGLHTDTACNITSPSVFQFNPGTQTINQYFFLGFTSVHATMVANGDAAKPIYLTEIGWSTTSTVCQTGAWSGQKAAGVDPATQAAYLQEAYHCLAQPQYAYVRAAMWFELVDNGASTDPLDNFGLLAADLTPKPAFAAFQAVSLHGDQLSGPCG